LPHRLLARIIHEIDGISLDLYATVLRLAKRALFNYLQVFNARWSRFNWTWIGQL